MDPMMMMAVLAGLNGLSGMTGKGEKHGSTYSKGARNAIDDVLQSIKGMKGDSMDITQNQQYQQGNDYFNSLFNDQDFFNKFEAPAMRQFEEMQGDIGNRFAGMGSGGSTGSTGFRNQMAREGQNFATNLAANRGQMQQNAVPQMLGYAQQPFQNLMSLYGIGTTPTQNTYQPASGGPFSGLTSSLNAGVMQGMGNNWGNQMANWMS